MKKFDGRFEAKKLDEKIKNYILEHPGSMEKELAIIQVGENPESQKYVNLKKRLGEKLGINVVVYKFSDALGDLELLTEMNALIQDVDVGGVIVQLPLPRPDLNKILKMIPVERDIDCLSEVGGEEVFKNDGGCLLRTSPVIRSTEHFVYSVADRDFVGGCVIVGGGSLVGLPISKMLKNLGWNVEIVEDYEPSMSLNGDLIVLSAGIPNLVKGEDISEGANVIDFGSSVVDGKTVGDLDMASKLEHLNFVSTSPGGMGPLVIRYLFMNFLGI